MPEAGLRDKRKLENRGAQERIRRKPVSGREEILDYGELGKRVRPEQTFVKFDVRGSGLEVGLRKRIVFRSEVCINRWRAATAGLPACRIAAGGDEAESMMRRRRVVLPLPRLPVISMMGVFGIWAIFAVLYGIEELRN